ncbi:MAG: hypothetical protein HUU28_07335 [Planctomycetaceae bacterium]|nr:hypothetical protein [Planctomycetaceae bacterium]
MKLSMHVSKLVLGLALAPAALAQELMVVDATNDRIMLVSAVDGSMINPNFISLSAGTGTPASLPIQAISNGAGEIWVSDQNADAVHRWSADGTTYLGQWGTGRDNIRGLHIDFGRVWLCNFGNGGAGYGLALKEYTPTTTFVASHAMPGSPFGVISHNGELLVSDTTNDDLVRVDPATGAVLGILHNSDGVSGVDFPGQLSKTAAGNILTVGLVTPVGIFEYDANGTQLNYFDGTGVLSTPQGVHALTNGNILVGAGNGLWLQDRTAGTYSVLVASIDVNYITPRGSSSSAPTTFCTAGTSSNGCVPAISAANQPSLSQAAPCVIQVANVEGQKTGLIFYGIDNTGFAPLPWGIGGSSFLCVKSPTQRMQPQLTGGTSGQCDGALAQDWDSFLAGMPGALGTPFGLGNRVYAQAWYRDPPAVKTTNLSDALELTVVP